jgi:aspartyl-tRNA(Asn)/glutamyl-tRNA(Gln) amidotransferase subunit C
MVYSREMADRITPELFDHLAELASLELTAEEAEYLRRELNNQLKAIDELAAIPIPDGTPAARHGVGYPLQVRPPMRSDQAIASGLADEIMAQAPETSDGYIAVPEIPHEELE